VQPLQLQVLTLQGVAVGDRGAALLARGLAGTRHLQVRVDLRMQDSWGPLLLTCMNAYQQWGCTAQALLQGGLPCPLSGPLTPSLFARGRLCLLQWGPF
jgi:hypothetical protein